MTKKEVLKKILSLYEELGKVPNTKDFGTSLHYVKKHFGTWGNALKAAGLKANKESLTKEQLIHKLLELHEELGRVPNKRDFPHIYHAEKKFGSWNNLLIAAGFKPNLVLNRPKEFYINEIHRYVKEFGHVPGYKEFEKNKEYPDPKHLCRITGLKWTKLLKSLNYEPRFEKGIEYTEEQIEQIFKEQYLKHKPKTLREYNSLRDAKTPQIETICSKLKRTYNDLISDFDISGNCIRRSNEEKLNLLKECYKALGKPPSMSIFDEYYQGSPCSATLRDTFGSWNNALRLCNIPVYYENSKVTETNEELLELYINYSNKLGKPASSNDLDNGYKKGEIYQSGVFTIRFGNMANLKKSANFPYISRQAKFKIEDIERELVSFYKKLGRKPTNKELADNKNIPCVSAICRYYKSTKTSVIWNYLIDKYNL